MHWCISAERTFRRDRGFWRPSESGHGRIRKSRKFSIPERLPLPLWPRRLLPLGTRSVTFWWLVVSVCTGPTLLENPRQLPPPNRPMFPARVDFWPRSLGCGRPKPRLRNKRATVWSSSATVWSFRPRAGHWPSCIPFSFWAEEALSEAVSNTFRTFPTGTWPGRWFTCWKPNLSRALSTCARLLRQPTPTLRVPWGRFWEGRPSCPFRALRFPSCLEKWEKKSCWEEPERRPRSFWTADSSSCIPPSKMPFDRPSRKKPKSKRIV
mmetsp:Transcript_3014/g.6275  ORF Transcript_3014/g.6275 Transcript_3014/m.6275 type:complete len:266 (-) Transcript_3014:43-840(-)